MSVFDNLVVSHIASYCTYLQALELITLAGKKTSEEYAELLGDKIYFRWLYKLNKHSLMSDEDFYEAAKHSAYGSYLALTKNIVTVEYKGALEERLFTSKSYSYEYFTHCSAKAFEPCDRFDEVAKRIFASDPMYLSKYASEVSKKRWGEGSKEELEIIKCRKSTCYYLKLVLKGKNWKLFSKEIMAGDAERMLAYVCTAIKNGMNIKIDINKIPPETMTVILNNPEYVYYYAKHYLKNRLSGEHARIGEGTISMHTKWAYKYAHNVIRGRWGNEDEISIAAEKSICKELKYAVSYAAIIIKGRWNDESIERIIASSPEYAYKYAYTVIKSRWDIADDIGKLAETTISKSAQHAYDYARYILNGRWDTTNDIGKMAEDTIFKSVYYTVLYAHNILCARLSEEMEEWILQSPNNAITYAAKVLGGRWDSLEKKILEGRLSFYASVYAYEVINGRWKEAEPIILTNAYHTYLYSRCVIKDNWPEAEGIIKKCGIMYISLYRRVTKI